jgi:hypothetical protein
MITYVKAHYGANTEKVRDRARAYADSNIPLYLWTSAAARSRKAGIPFSITPDDVVVPAHCPVLGIPLLRGHGKGATAGAPSLDRKVPELGYVPGNVVVISWRANTLKRDATRAEVQAVADWMGAEGLA